MQTDELIKAALAEDIGEGDHTTEAIFPETHKGKARLKIKQEGVLAGAGVAEKIFNHLDPEIKFRKYIDEGSRVKPGDIVFEVTGSSRAILTGERTALNFMQRLSGIATYTASLVKLIEGTGAVLLDTRKTTPMLRHLEKEAVRLGGAQNHRLGLYDMVMIKDNHIDFAGGIEQAITAVKQYLNRAGKNLKIEIEVRNMEELDRVLNFGGVDRIMLDNFTPEELSGAVKLIGGRYETEASGGITEANIREYALTGVDFISVGALTHQIRSLDMSLLAEL
ncbi:MAG: carboxylating nicotinate-nucleotide diphosphorylase [Bacteroidales bacterium]